MKNIFSFALSFIFFSGIIAVTFCQSNSLIIKENKAKINNPLEQQVGTDVLTWDNGFFASLSLGQNGTVIVAARFADTLTVIYSGYNLVQIEIYVGDMPVSLIVKVFDEGTDSSAGSLIYSQDVSNLIVPDSYNTFDLNPSILITGNDIWIGYEVTVTATQFVMGLDNGPVHPDGDWIFDTSFPSLGWYHLSDFGFNNNWVIRGYLDDIIPVELTSFTVNSANGNVALNWSTATETNNMMFEIERRNEVSDFVLIGFVEGSGTTTETQSYNYIDKELSSGKYLYRLKQVDYDGSFEYSEVVEVDATPISFSLEQNYPNPFNPSTTIKYSIPTSEFVTLKVYDVLGNGVAALVNEEKPASSYEVNFNATGLSSGIYFYTLQAGSFTQTKKLILIK